MTSEDELERRFHRAMEDIYHAAKSNVGYTATRFMQMVQEQGGLSTARQLLAKTDKEVSHGFTELALANRLDLSMEALVLQDEWKPLFSDTELATARRRLR